MVGAYTHTSTYKRNACIHDDTEKTEETHAGVFTCTQTERSVCVARARTHVPWPFARTFRGNT